MKTMSNSYSLHKLEMNIDECTRNSKIKFLILLYMLLGGTYLHQDYFYFYETSGKAKQNLLA